MIMNIKTSLVIFYNSYAHQIINKQMINIVYDYLGESTNYAIKVWKFVLIQNQLWVKKSYIHSV